MHASATAPRRKTTRAYRERVAAWEHVRVVVPEPRKPDGSRYVSRRAMAVRLRALYGLDTPTHPDDEYQGHLFYNNDLRSICGEIEEEDGEVLVLRLRTTHWLGRWGRKPGEPFQYDATYDAPWKRLLEDAESVERAEA